MSNRSKRILAMVNKENENPQLSEPQSPFNNDDLQTQNITTLEKNSNNYYLDSDTFDLENMPVYLMDDTALENELFQNNNSGVALLNVFPNNDALPESQKIINIPDHLMTKTENITACDASQSNVNIPDNNSKPLVKRGLVPYESSSDDQEGSESGSDDYSPSGEESNSSKSSTDNESTSDVTKEDSVRPDADNSDADNQARKRKRVPDPSLWNRNKNKRLRMKGKSYLGFTKSKGEKMKMNCPRNARSLKETCISKKCKNSKVRFCTEISDDCRKGIFTAFWSDMNWEQRKVFIASHVMKLPTRKKTKENSRRHGTYHYYLNDGIENLEVCRSMFLNTLDLGYKTVQAWVDNSNFGMSKESATGVTTKEYVRRRFATDYGLLDEFFDSLPKLPSHYCRRDTLKLYLEYSFQNMAQLYSVYCNDYCKDKKVTPLGRNVFSKKFKEKNLSLYKPKKDQCNTCFSFKYGNISEEQYQLHIKRKELAREAKTSDKADAEKGKLIVITMDLQAVKLCPYLPANKIYFKTKLCCHNFTVYDLKTKDALCYWFSEDQNNILKASTFTSCIINYLEENCLTNSRTPIVMFSDGCGYQNRNCVLSNALLNFAVRHNTFVYQKFLEPGHTQMECDSVHSVIERHLRHREIHLPSDYESVTKEARKTPAPYRTRLLESSFFKDFSASKYLRYSSIRPGKKSNDPVINDIKCIQYDPCGLIKVKLDYDGEYQELPCRPKAIPTIVEYPQLLDKPCKIKSEKWHHLQELKTVLPKDTHAFYDALLHE